MQREDSKERDRFTQEEHRFRRDMLRCSTDITPLQAQIKVLDFEFSLM